ncbi:MAG: UDP-3-O-acyl-N-acetylglucosamine deacetylase [Kiritimatiellae bacterium]|nr:UDP-3-O-acyl-N-acetylglucosamine deacetylase [Kiritimatiellia bacterium]
MEMPQYPIGRIVSGSEASIRAAYEEFKQLEIDEVKVLESGEDPYGEYRTTLASEAPVSGSGTFQAGTRQTLTFAPSEKPGWWIRRMDLPEQLDTEVHVKNLWTSAQNLVLRSGSPHNYLRMVEHIIALKLGLGVDNVLIKVNSGDPPLFNESSLPLVKAIEHAKIVKTETKATYITVKEPVAFGGKRGDFLLFLPAKPGDKKLHIDCAIKWNTIIGTQRVVFDASYDTFRYASLARTNATLNQYRFAKTIGKLFAATRNWGYDDKKILIHGPKKYYTKQKAQECFEKPSGKYLEPIWHRATLDLMAALSLTGADRLCGTVVSFRAGHTQDCDAIRALYRNNLLTQVE